MKKVLLSLLFAATLFADEFIVMTEDLKPYNYLQDGELKGISVELVQKILENLNYNEQEISVYPWARAEHILQTNPKAVLFSMSYTPQRAKEYKFACPLSEVEVFLFVNKDTPLNVQNLEDARELTIGVVKDFAAHKYLVERGFTGFDYSSSTKVMVEKLTQNKIDAFVATPYSVFSLDVDSSKVKQTQVRLYATNLCIAFNKEISDTEVQKWQEQLQKLRQSEFYETIYKKYIGG